MKGCVVQADLWSYEEDLTRLEEQESFKDAAFEEMMDDPDIRKVLAEKIISIQELEKLYWKGEDMLQGGNWQLLAANLRRDTE